MSIGTILDSALLAGKNASYRVIKSTWKPLAKASIALSSLATASHYYCPAYIIFEHDLKATLTPIAYAEIPKEWSDYADLYAAAHHRNKCLVRAVIKVESRNCTQLESKAGALGCMQIMPATGKGLGLTSRSQLLDIESNIAKGEDLLFQLIDQHGIFTGLQIYNAGANRVNMTKENRDYPHKVLAEWANCIDEVTVGLPIEDLDRTTLASTIKVKTRS